MREITKYFGNAIMASLQGTLSYKERKFVTIKWQEIENGRVDAQELNELWKGITDREDEKSEETTSRNILIAMKTIATDFIGGSRESVSDEMTSVFFVPAKVYKDGTLGHQEDKYPWIPRECLTPMIDPQIAIGSEEEYDAFFERTTDERNQIDSWKKYLEYAIEMFEYVTKSRFCDLLLGEQQIKTDGKFYIFEDETINSVSHLAQFYKHMKNDTETRLYSRITSGIIEPSKTVQNKLNFNKMLSHVGQMGGEYPLSPSQREAINCFDEIGEGDVLAVNGPPGTGKTTLLQSIVANMYVKSALAKKEAPGSIATSTNNQAVTNIIDSFGKINSIGIKNLEERWITGIDSFAVYFPSKGKMEEARKKGYQYTDVHGSFFVEALESADNREQAKVKFQEKYAEYFGKEIASYMDARDDIHRTLSEVEEKKETCVTCMKKMKEVIGDQTIGEYISWLKEQILAAEERLGQQEERKSLYMTEGQKLLERVKEWRYLYNALPWYVRLLKFIPCFKKKIVAWSYQNMTYEELDFLDRGMGIEEIEYRYHQKINENDACIKSVVNGLLKLKNEKGEWEQRKKQIDELFKRTEQSFAAFEIYGVSLTQKNWTDNIRIEDLNNSLDKVRYVEFWLAVHYYEALWLQKDRDIRDNQKGKTFENVLNGMYCRLAMLTPCMVMTCYMLPKQFYAYDGNEKKHYYMYNYADLLIVDEAGQISPEVGMPAFAFAKKAVVVGDECQISPVWGTPRALDIAIAISNNVIKEEEEYHNIEQNGLNCSQSSVMKIANLSCLYKKYEKGLFLSEHRRCYNEIIAYCNKLVYKGKLEPLRGNALDDKNYVLAGYLPPMGHKQIESIHSERVGTSRQNTREAEVIVAWIKMNYAILYKKYEAHALKRNEQFDGKGMLGVITPFKGQSNLIKRIIKREIPEIEKNISVGTVHTFQGAERNIIIFSSVYGNKEGCYFIDKNKSLMNVAVSRAKDSFLVFGDCGCLKGDSKSAGEMLRIATEREIS